MKNPRKIKERIERMDNFKEQVSQVTDHFLGEVAGLAHRHATSILASAFSSLGGVSRELAESARGKPTGLDKAPLSRGRGAKRGPDELEKLGSRFALFVRENPGLRIEQINKKLGTATSDLALPIRKLIACGAISTQGEKRSTTYHLGKSFVSRVIDGKSGKLGKAGKSSPEKTGPRGGGASKAPGRSRTKSRSASQGRRSKPRVRSRPGRSSGAKEPPAAK